MRIREYELTSPFVSQIFPQFRTAAVLSYNEQIGSDRTFKFENWISDDGYEQPTYYDRDMTYESVYPKWFIVKN